MNPYDEPILRALRQTDKEHPVLSPELERAFGLSGETLRQIIHALCMAGHPICSGRQGYYFARYAEEMDDPIANIAGRRKSLQERETAMRRTQAGLPSRTGRPTVEQIGLL